MAVGRNLDWPISHHAQCYRLEADTESVEDLALQPRVHVAADRDSAWQTWWSSGSAAMPDIATALPMQDDKGLRRHRLVA